MKKNTNDMLTIKLSFCYYAVKLIKYMIWEILLHFAVYLEI